MTQPPRAALLIDGNAVGVTPYDSLELSPGLHRMTVKADEYLTKNFTFDLPAGTHRTFTMQLTPEFAFFSTTVSPPDAMITLDGGEPITGSLVHFKTATGPHTIVVAHPSFPNTINSTIVLGPGTLTRTTGALDHFSLTAFELSAIVPGLGQFLDGAIVKGSLEMAFLLATGLNAIHEQSQYREQERLFLATQETYRAAGSELAAAVQKEQMRARAIQFSDQKKRRRNAFIALGSVYGITLIDALLNHSDNHMLFVEPSQPVPMTDGQFIFPDTDLRITIPIR